jgi:hypothetical protein
MKWAGDTTSLRNWISNLWLLARDLIINIFFQFYINFVYFFWINHRERKYESEIILYIYSLIAILNDFEGERV